MRGVTTDWLGGVARGGGRREGGREKRPVNAMLFALWVDLNQRAELNVDLF